MAKNVLYISYDGMTDPLGQSQVIPYLRELSKQGYRFCILSAEKPENYQKNKKQIETILHASGIDWEPIMYTKKPPVVSTVKDIRKLIKKAKTLHRKYQFSLTHCRSYISAFAGMKLKKQFGVPFLFDMRGFYADERVDGDLWKQSNPVFKMVYRYFKKKEKQFMNACDHLISLTEAGKEVIVNWKFKHLKTDDITVIPCCADLNHFSPENVSDNKLSELRSQLNIAQDKFVLSYLGSVGTWYLPAEMLDFFAELLKEKPNSIFLVVTRDNVTNMQKMANEKGIPADSIVYYSADRNEVPALLKLSDLSLFFIKPVFSKKASSPTKLAEILGMGVPVICNGNVGDIDRIIERHQLGLVLNEFTADAYRNAIEHIPKLLEIQPDKLRTVSDNLFSLREGSKRYLSVYKSIEK